MKIALRLFAICPNSASCERLFSAFGNILTKKRTSLSTTTMTSLARLKLHLRDEEIRSGTLSERASRRFVELKSPDASASTSSLPNTTHTAEPDDEAVDADTETEMSEAEAEAGGGASSATQGRASGRASSLSAIIERLKQMSADDDKDGVFVSQSGGPYNLMGLFDWDHSYWRKALDGAGKGMQDELRAYELAENSADRGESNGELLEEQVDF